MKTKVTVNTVNLSVNLGNTQRHSHGGPALLLMTYRRGDDAPSMLGPRKMLKETSTSDKKDSELKDTAKVQVRSESPSRKTCAARAAATTARRP